jgi:hypothetical protein
MYNYGKIIDNMDSADVYQEQNDSSPVISQLNKREYFLILSSKDGWSNILTMSNITGYIADSYVNVKGTACGAASIDLDGDRMHTYLYMDASFLASASETVTDGDYIIILDNSDSEGFDDMNIVLTKFGIRGYIDEKYVKTIFPKKD